MSDELKSPSVHFQLLILGTILFLGAFIWGTMPEHSPTGQLVNQELSIVFGLSAIAGYLAFVVLVVGHALLVRQHRPQKNPDQRNERDSRS